MSMSNPLTDARQSEEELIAQTQQQLLKAITEEQEKIRRKDEIKNVQAKGEDFEEPEVSI